jgi:HK97 family phage major capsid protein
VENPNLTPDQVVEKINGLITEKMKSTASIEDIDCLKSQVEGLKGLESKSSDMEKAIAKMEGRIEAMNERALNEGVKSITLGEQVTKGLSENMESVKNGKDFNLEVKADTTLAGDYTGTRAISELDPVVNRIARQKVLLQNAVNRGTINTMYVTYIQQTAQPTGAWTAEGVAKTEYEEKYTEVSKQVKKIAGMVKVSKEMLDDLSFVRTEINNDLIEGVVTGLDNSILNGAGGSDLEGILSFASTFAAGTFANTIISANILDVIRVSMSQIEASKFTPTHVVLNPVDVAKMQLTKTTTGEYTMPIFYPSANNEMKVASLTVVSTTYMTAGNFLVGDMTRANLRVRENANIQIGYVNDDFARNMVTILAELRAVHYVKLNDANAFVKGVLATAITALDPAL